GPRLLHVVTKKGKGYLPAEADPVRFHGLGPFDINDGVSLAKDCSVPTTYTEIFGKKLVELGEKDKKIVAITAAMPEGTGLDKFHGAFPERFFDVGIAEGHAVCFASGLARQGLKPVVAIYSTFLQRAYDQIIEDVALQETAVVFAVDRAGIVGEDGVTHQGIFDISFLRSVPNLNIMAPSCAIELEMMLEFAFELGKPVAIRYPRGRASVYGLQSTVCGLELGKAEVLREGADFLVIALGSMVAAAEEALDLLAKKNLHGTLINARFIKPLDKELFNLFSARSKHIFTIEEGIVDGGFGSAVAESLNKPVIRIGLPCAFIPHGKRDILLEKYGLTPKGIADKIRAII
ncbi:MAG: transketolase C-terminal domain-containing protein, partial [Candidatus Omnitrophota bacterium]